MFGRGRGQRPATGELRDPAPCAGGTAVMHTQRRGAVRALEQERASQNWSLCCCRGALECGP